CVNVRPTHAVRPILSHAEVSLPFSPALTERGFAKNCSSCGLVFERESILLACTGTAWALLHGRSYPHEEIANAHRTSSSVLSGKSLAKGGLVADRSPGQARSRRESDRNPAYARVLRASRPRG